MIEQNVNELFGPNTDIGLPKCVRKRLENIEKHWKASASIWKYGKQWSDSLFRLEDAVWLLNGGALLGCVPLSMILLKRLSSQRWYSFPLFSQGSSLLTGFARAYSVNTLFTLSPGIEIFLLAALYSDYSIKKETIRPPIPLESVRDLSRLESKHRMEDHRHSIE